MAWATIIGVDDQIRISGTSARDPAAADFGSDFESKIHSRAVASTEVAEEGEEGR